MPLLGEVDILEDDLVKVVPGVLDILLKDRTTGRNILWGTEDYAALGHHAQDEIRLEAITGENGRVIRPRTAKAAHVQRRRSVERAEVFTPAWVVNAQNDLIDAAWFGAPTPFVIPKGRHCDWEPTQRAIPFPEGRTWRDYVRLPRLEITCGEAPYLTTRYDATTGLLIPVPARVGILDRKLRVVSENTRRDKDWMAWAKHALRATYGYDWQGDNLLLARENLLAAVIEARRERFPKTAELSLDDYRELADIISWNLWQMDGLRCVPPGANSNPDLLDNPKPAYCRILDWSDPRRPKPVFVRALFEKG